MTLTRRPSPFRELVTLRQAMDRLFDDTIFRPSAALTGSGELTRLPLDVRTTPDALHVEASLPGIRPEDVEITVLKLRFPKAEQTKPRQIRIQPVTPGEAEAVAAGNGTGTEPAGTGA